MVPSYPGEAGLCFFCIVAPAAGEHVFPKFFPRPGEPLWFWWFFQPKVEKMNSFDVAQCILLTFLSSSALPSKIRASKVHICFAPRVVSCVSAAAARAFPASSNPYALLLWPFRFLRPERLAFWVERCHGPGPRLPFPPSRASARGAADGLALLHLHYGLVPGKPLPSWKLK